MVFIDEKELLDRQYYWIVIQNELTVGLCLMDGANTKGVCWFVPGNECEIKFGVEAVKHITVPKIKGFEGLFPVNVPEQPKVTDSRETWLKYIKEIHALGLTKKSRDYKHPLDETNI